MPNAIEYISYLKLVERASHSMLDTVKYMSRLQSVEQASCSMPSAIESSPICSQTQGSLVIPCLDYYHFKATKQLKISNDHLTSICSNIRMVCNPKSLISECIAHSGQIERALMKHCAISPLTHVLSLYHICL